MKKSIIASSAMLLSAYLLTGCVIHVGDANALEGSDFSSILGNIDIAELAIIDFFIFLYP